ncbi:Uma2 family endonuclease [Streptosporangium sp. NBC_01755]|uniref:Uma2 family endonuclease n=1 Tax=unclassified Streptosporangium TaxID=2632669 RepID=UPI002DD9BF88|nr:MULTISPECIES: Uma2 family endonuclease [unclassified Streptosporangium]WSA22815.1 Uma2 family endonuclease [Streptosporangium sp. NBC_01810]WSC99041.1 Uma2 family endonuclease [Streptosporangium sp. NBC_01755]
MTVAHESEPYGSLPWAPRYWGSDEFMIYDFGDIGRRFELEDGCIVMTPAPSIRHQRIARRLINAIEACLQAENLGLDVEGPVNYRLNSDTVFAPDIAVFRRDTDSDLYVEPHEIEILAEVTSTNSNRDRLTKMNRYARTKCEWYWIIDQNTLVIDVYQLDGDLYRQVTALTPGTAALLPGPVPLTIDPATLA